MTLHNSYRGTVNVRLNWVNWSFYVAIVALDSARASDVYPCLTTKMNRSELKRYTFIFRHQILAMYKNDSISIMSVMLLPRFKQRKSRTVLRTSKTTVQREDKFYIN